MKKYIELNKEKRWDERAFYFFIVEKIIDFGATKKFLAPAVMQKKRIKQQV